MAQSDQVVQNATFPTVRADINDNLAALYSQNSGNSAPAVTVAFQPWVDTSSSPPVWKVRNGSNSAWITVGVLDPAGFNAGGVTAIANGGTGATTATAALAALLPSQGGNAGKALVTSGSAASWTTVNGITSGTAVASTSGTSIDFISIPAGVKRVTVMFSGVSTSGASVLQIQIGTSSGVQTTGYLGSYGYGQEPSFNLTTGFGIYNDTSTDIFHGSSTLNLLDSSSGVWTWNSMYGWNTRAYQLPGAGSKTLSGTLDRVRITTVSGADTFDAGSINISWES
jgi:hypothetical protein